MVKPFGKEMRFFFTLNKHLWHHFHLIVLETTDDYEETWYLFILNINDTEIKAIENGLYIYSYNCNSTLKQSNSNNPIHEAALIPQ